MPALPACFGFQTLYANAAEEQGAIWIDVAPAGTMSHFTGYPTQSGPVQMPFDITQVRSPEIVF